MAKAWKTFSLVAVVVLVSSLVAAASPTGAQASPSSTGDMEFTLYAGDYEIVEDDGGLDVVQMEGFSSTAEAGNPTLPHEVFNIAVPPDIDWESLQLEVISAETETLDGTYDIGPAALPVAQQEGGALVDGKNPDVYGNDADFPENYVSLLPYSQMRKWSFTRVDFTPFQYNPVSGELTLIESVTIAISYERTGAMLDESLLADTAMDDIASETFLNYEDAKGWYEPELALMSQAIEPQNGTYDYVIITTNVIEAGSTELANFVAHKTSLGFTVLVITEDEYSGLAGEPPDTRAERIRQWLKNNYSSMGIQYVLLIGDPTPGGSGTVDVPMQMCHPEANNSYDDIVATPTDYYYADLTGDWDYDNDTLFGEWVDDYPVGGGVDFTAEVYVGRIPVYSESYTALDSILDKVITYETDTGDTSWRQNILLPMGFQASGYDGANLGQQMKTNYLDGAGYSSWRMYQQSEADPCSLDSTFPSEEGLNGGTSAPSVYDRWTGASGTPNDFGIVCWWAHGSATSASVGYSGCWDGTLFQSSPSNWCTSLDDSHPAFTYQCSCLNGYPENSANLQYSILANGGIATVSASRVSWFYSGETDFTSTPTNSGIGYHYVNRLVNLNPAGQALYDTKAAIEDSSLPHWLMNWCDFNLYGDPAVSLEAAEGEATHDFGDAPDPNYPTLLANNGARHLVPVEFAIWMGPSLVNNTDLELDGQPTNLDDAIGIDDEDGVTFYGSSTSPTGPWSLPYIAGDYGRLDVEVNGTGFPGCLHAWIDFNQDGDWDDAGENILCSGTVSSAGIYQIVFNVPADAVGGTTWARFRLDEEASCLNSPVGEATNGEVEDYPVVIGVPDIRVDPTEFCLVLPPDSGWGAYLRIYNDGDTDLDYDLSEAEVTSSTSTELPPGIEPVSGVLELPADFELESSAVEPESPVPSLGWEYLIMDGFEGTWPGIWNFYIDGSDAYWGQETYRANGPTHSAYCAKNGTLGVAAPGPYPNGMFSWMFAGPYNLEDAIAAEWSFSFWLDSEDGADNFYMMVSTDGYVYSGWYTTGDSGGWVDVSLDLSDVPYVGDCRGELEVYVAFIFESDGNATSDEGAYVDDVGLRYDTGCDWLNVLPNSGSVPPGEYDDLLVTVDTTGLMPSSGGCPSCSGGEPESSAGPIDVLLVAADSNVATVQTYLSTFADIATVDIFNANGGTPALSLLQSYDSVLVWSNATFDDPAALGDVLADYVDSGGCVTVATFAWTGYGASLEGRFETGLYDPFVQVGATLYSWADLGLYNSSSPLMSGVTSITGYFRDAVSLASGATLVASWDDGYPFVAHKGRVIGVNLFPAIAGTGYDWTGDVPTLFHNALIWCSSYLWCGDTCCEIVISSNDPDEDPVIVPVCVSIAIDYGDAPDPPYPSLRANDGARHYPGSIWLGTAPTAELDSLQVDLDTHDDGVTFLGSSPNYGGPFTLPYARGQWGAVQVEVNGTGQGCVHGWIDWNDDGDWDDTDENVFCSEVVSAPGTYTFVFSVPVDAVSGQTWSRFRLDYYEELPPSAGELESAGVPGCMNSYTGLALDGEVEDYPVNVEYIPPEGWSSDDIGVEVNAYCEFEDVYTTGSGFAWDTGVDIYVVPDQAWSDGMSIPADVTGRADVGKDTGGTPIWTDINGDLGPVCIWLAPVDPGDYDIVFDANKNGVYDALIDYVDHPNHPGFVINECPFAAFIASPVSGSAPLTVQFVDQSTGYITSWLWYFGDGTTSAAQHPSHVYNYGGAYTVTLTVTGPCGTDVATGYIEVIEEVAPARIIVRNLLIEPANALPGQQVVISADVVNQGGIRGSKRIDLVINGYAEQAIRVGVDPGAAQHITFYTSKTVPGTYEVFIEGQASAFNVFIRPRVTTSEGFAGGLSTAAIITIVVIAVIFLVGLIIVFMRVRR